MTNPSLCQTRPLPSTVRPFPKGVGASCFGSKSASLMIGWLASNRQFFKLHGTPTACPGFRATEGWRQSSRALGDWLSGIGSRCCRSSANAANSKGLSKPSSNRAAIPRRRSGRTAGASSSLSAAFPSGGLHGDDRDHATTHLASVLGLCRDASCLFQAPPQVQSVVPCGYRHARLGTSFVITLGGVRECGISSAISSLIRSACG